MTIWLVTGLWVILGCAQAAHLITLITDRSLQTYTQLCGIFVAAGMLVYVGILCRMRRKWPKPEKINSERKVLWQGVLFAVLTVLTLVHFWQGYVPDLQDAVYDITIGNVESGRIMEVHPFLGQAGGSGMPLRMKILGLSSLYSSLITISQQSTYMIMCKMVPIVIWCCTMLVYQAFGEKLFAHNREKRWLFLSMIALFLLITSKSMGLAGYRVFFAGFSGETIRGVLLMPYALYVSWQRKWLLAVLSIVAEACLVWTTWGIGYCTVIVVCMLLVHLWADRRCKHAGGME